MKDSFFSWQEIKGLIDQIRSANRVRHITNCFFQHQEGQLLTLASDKAIIFGSNDNGFMRLFYFCAEIESLKILLQFWPKCYSTVIGYVDKTRNPKLCDVLTDSGFIQKACYQRMINRNLPVRIIRTEPDFARLEEAEDLHILLNKIFDPMTDYLPEIGHFGKMIASQQVIVRRQAGEITAALVFQLVGKQVNFNFLLSSNGNSLDLLTLMNNFYHIMVKRNISSGFLWVNSQSTGVIKMHQAFGWEFDGLNDWFFVCQPALSSRHDL